MSLRKQGSSVIRDELPTFGWSQGALLTLRILHSASPRGRGCLNATLVTHSKPLWFHYNNHIQDPLLSPCSWKRWLWMPIMLKHLKNPLRYSDESGMVWLSCLTRSLMTCPSRTTALASSGCGACCRGLINVRWEHCLYVYCGEEGVRATGFTRFRYVHLGLVFFVLVLAENFWGKKTFRPKIWVAFWCAILNIRFFFNMCCRKAVL